MSTVASKNTHVHRDQGQERILDVEIRDAEQRVYFTLEDGRIVGVPFDWSWRLSDARAAQDLLDLAERIRRALARA